MSSINIPARAWSTYRSIRNAGQWAWSANDNYNKQQWPGITPDQYRVLRDAFSSLGGEEYPKAQVERFLTGEHKVCLCYAQADLVARAAAAFGKRAR